MKKALSILLALAMIMLSATAVSAETSEVFETEDGHYKYTLEDGKATLVYTNDEYEQHIEYYTVPETVDGYPIVGIASTAYGELTYIHNLIIPDCIKFIEAGTFNMLPYLETVKIGSGVEKIGSGAFGYCVNLTKFEVSEDNDYYTVDSGILYTKDMKTLVQYPAGRNFFGYNVPYSVEEIYPYAFQGNEYIHRVTLNDGLKSIGKKAFDDCHSLLEVYIPSTVTEFGTDLFWGTDVDFKIVCMEDSEAAKYAKENNINCKYIVATSLKLNCATIKWPVGKSASFKATILPEEASRELEWTSSNPDVATVSSTGKLTAVGVGTTTITCKTTDGSNLTATVKVTVGPQVSSLKLNATSLTCPLRKIETLKATIAPTDAVNQKLTWTSSNSDVATIDANGKLIAVGVGTAVITCKTTDGSNLSATCTVTVNSKAASSLKLNAKFINWQVGKSGHFKPTVLPADCASQKLIWTSSNPKVATVNENGKLTAVSAGTTTITCMTTDGSDLKATCTVTVGKLVTSVKLNCKTINWPVGKSASYKATVSPSNAANKKLSWTSSNPKVATISSTGKLTAVGAGTTTITCKATDGSGKYATCKVTVYAIKITGITLNAKSILWEVGKSGYFKATVAPENATNKTLKWVSLNPEVATVSSAGKLTAVSAGTAKIVCKSTDGSGRAAVCNVMVTESGKPTNYTNLFKNYFRDGCYAINGTVDYVDENDNYVYSTDIQFGVTATSCYMYEKMQDGSTKTFSGPNGTYTLLNDVKLSEGFTYAEAKALGLPLKHFYVEKDYYIKLGNEPLKSVLLENLTYKSTTTEKINGVTYTKESFYSDTEDTEVVFYFSKGKLCYIDWITSEIQLYYTIKSIQGTFKLADYKVPSGYVEIAGDAWDCLL